MSTDITVKQEDVPFDVSFKSTLPPRKRAKTEEEKEQRRVERILRNRRAAHASREKKRKHVEYLEAYVLELENKLQQVQTNFDAVYAKLSPQQVADLGELSSVSVCLDLKDKISTNLTGSKKIEVKEEFVLSPLETPTTNNNKRSYDEVAAADEEDSMSVQDTTYYNYLSPVSINSPINSPIDLTLTLNPESLSPQNSYGLMEQSSAVTLCQEPPPLCLSCPVSVFDRVARRQLYVKPDICRWDL